MTATGVVTKIFAVVCLFSLTTAKREFNDLRVRTNAYGLDKSDAFYEIPTTTSSPLFQDYVKAQPEPSFQYPLDFYCHHGDPRVCFMYDKKGNVAGIQISILKQDVAKVKSEHYDFAGNPNFLQTNFYNNPAYSIRAYFTNPEKLTAAGRQNTDKTADGLWTFLDGDLVEIQREQPTGPKMGNFDRQGCYPAMGQHYFYKYNKDSNCKNLYAFFPLYEKGLVGFGIAVPGSLSKGPHRDWFEKPTAEVAKVVAPNVPPCNDISKNYGYTTLHVFFVEKPWDISCP